MIAQYNLHKEVHEAREMIKRLETYLRGEELYGLAGTSAYSGLPRLTLGSLLFRLRRLSVLYSDLSDEMKHEVHELSTKHDALRDEWRVHYVNKLSHEASARLHMINYYLEDCENGNGDCADMFDTELTRRTILQEVLKELSKLGIQHNDVRNDVQDVDRLLRKITVPSDFRWEPELRIVYPSDEFWWLYTAYADDIA